MLVNLAMLSHCFVREIYTGSKEYKSKVMNGMYGMYDYFSVYELCHCFIFDKFL